MQSIKHALTERHYTWEDAVNVAKDDPEIVSTEDGLVYQPSAYEDEDVDLEDGWQEVEKDGELQAQERQEKTLDATR